MDAAEEVTAFCNQVIEEVTGLRFVTSKVGPHSSPAQVLGELWDTRVRLDRVEELLLQIYKLKESAHDSHTVDKAIYSDKWDEESLKLAKDVRRHEVDFTSAKERAAEINTKIIEFKSMERKSEKMLNTLTSTFEYVKLVQRGIDNYKNDLQSIIKIYQIEVSIGGRR